MLAPKAANRPILLATLMFALLLLSLAGAAVLIHLKGGLAVSALTPPQKIGSVDVRLPKGWVVTYTRSGSTEFITAIEPEQDGRRLDIRATDMDANTDAADSFRNSMPFRLMQLKREDVRMVEEVKVPGGSGFVIHPKKGVPVGVIAFEDGRAVTIELTRPMGSSSVAVDDAIIYDVATSVRLNELPAETGHDSGAAQEI